MRFSTMAVAAFAAAIMALASPAAAQGAPTAPGAGPKAEQTVPLIEVGALKALMKSKQRFFLIDVRRQDEFAGGHIDGAVPMPLDTLPQTYRQIPKGVKLVVYCRSGHRSAQAVSFLLANGYGQAVSLDGGFLAWTGAR